MPLCVQCGSWIDTTVDKKHSTVKICSQCNLPSDPYIEKELIIKTIDIFLQRPAIFRHFLFNYFPWYPKFPSLPVSTIIPTTSSAGLSLSTYYTTREKNHWAWPLFFLGSLYLLTEVYVSWYYSTNFQSTSIFVDFPFQFQPAFFKTFYTKAFEYVLFSSCILLFSWIYRQWDNWIYQSIRFRKGPIFGRIPSTPDDPIYIFLTTVFDILANYSGVEGLFRLTGQNDLKNELLDKIKKDPSKTKRIVHEWFYSSPDHAHIHTLTAVLKQYFNSLDSGIMKQSEIDEIIKILSHHHDSQKFYQLSHFTFTNSLIVLPFLNLLHLIHQNRDLNKMGADGIAKVLTPSLVWSKNDSADELYSALPGNIALIIKLIIIAPRISSAYQGKDPHMVVSRSYQFYSRYRPELVLSGLILAAFAKLFLVFMLVWNYPFVYIHVVNVFVLTSIVAMLSVVNRSSVASASLITALSVLCLQFFYLMDMLQSPVDGLVHDL